MAIQIMNVLVELAQQELNNMVFKIYDEQTGKMYFVNYYYRNNKIYCSGVKTYENYDK